MGIKQEVQRKIVLLRGYTRRLDNIQSLLLRGHINLDEMITLTLSQAHKLTMRTAALNITDNIISTGNELKTLIESTT